MSQSSQQTTGKSTDEKLIADHARPADTSHGEIKGLDLRDYYAGQALDALLEFAHRKDTPSDSTLVRKSTVARWSYEMADAMIAERNRTK